MFARLKLLTFLLKYDIFIARFLIFKSKGVAFMIHRVDTSVDPFLPDVDWKVEYHKKDGVLEFDPEKISLYLSEKQKNKKTI